jgi:Ser/Thr protein kinase RdoA (MazF antagonist)
MEDELMAERIQINGGLQNDVFYKKETNKIIRLSKSNKSELTILDEIKWMIFLSENGIPLSKPDMKIEKEESRIKTSFDFIKGEQIEVTNPFHWNDCLFKQWGKILGKMHALSKVYKVDENHRPIWSVEDPDVFNIRKNLFPWLTDKYDSLMQSLYSFDISRGSFGLIHNDFHQGNLIINANGSITVIDFDDCAYNWFAQDIAVAFYHAYWQHNSFNGNDDLFPHTFLNNFIKGYRSENILHPDTVKQIPIFLKLREIFLYQLFIKSWNLTNLEEWQKYTLNDLENKIKNNIPYADIIDFSIFTNE